MVALGQWKLCGTCQLTLKEEKKYFFKGDALSVGGGSDWSIEAGE